MTAPDPAEAARLRRLNTLLAQALALPAEDRSAWLQALPAADQAHAATLAALLARAAVETDGFLQRPVAEALGSAWAANEPAAGDRVGPWRLVGELGHGGMGTVWRAERADGSLARQVALKLPRELAPGLAQRMARERDILASLEHPRIARLYDAGVADDGRPWLAMELVEGEPIDTYCKRRALGVAERVRLVLQVAEAVSYAHARLVVHRDLKPSNILVTPEGEVRLLDFGVARLLRSDAMPDARRTQFPGAAFTPDYASPEQVRGEPLTLASDVYALAVVTYELLSGARPYTPNRATPAALEEAIIEADVPPASQRCTDPAVARALRGDLDNILAKALKKRAAERYPTVDALADDLRRHLQRLPVSARPDRLGYRAQRFVQRHWVGLLSLGAVALSLAVGLGAALWQAREARAQAERALWGLDKAEASFEFASAMLMEGVRSDETLTLAQLVERGVVMAEKSFAGSPAERAVSVSALATWLGQMNRYAEADALLVRTLTTLPADADPTLVGLLRCQHGHSVARMGQPAEGAREIDAGIEAARGDAEITSFCLHRRAISAAEMVDPRAQLDFMQRALQMHERSHRRSRLTRAHLLADLGGALRSNGRMAEAERSFAEAFALFDAVGRGDSPLALAARNNWAVELSTSGDPRRALALFDEVAAAEERRSPTRRRSGAILANRAGSQVLLGRLDEAEAGYRELLDLGRREQHALHQLRAQVGLAAVEAARGRLDEAQAHLDEVAWRIKGGVVTPVSRPALNAKLAQAQVWAAGQRLADADRLLDELVQILAQRGTRDGLEAQALVLRSDIALQQGRWPEAQAHAAAALHVADTLRGGLAHSVLNGRALLAQARAAQARGDPAARRAAAQSAFEHLQAVLGDGHAQVDEARRLAAAS